MLFGIKLSRLYVECATLLFFKPAISSLRASLTTIFIVFLSTLCSVFYGNIMSSNFLDVIGQNSFPRHFPCTSPAPGLTLRAPFSNILYLLLSCCRSSHTTTCTFLFFSTLRVTLLLSSPLYHRHHVHVTDWTDRSSQHTNSNIALSSPAVNFFIAAPPQFTLIHGLRPVTTAFHTTVHVHHDMLHFHASTFLFSSAFSFGNHHSVALVVRNLFLFVESFLVMTNHFFNTRYFVPFVDVQVHAIHIVYHILWLHCSCQVFLPQAYPTLISSHL